MVITAMEDTDSSLKSGLVITDDNTSCVNGSILDNTNNSTELVFLDSNAERKSDLVNG